MAQEPNVFIFYSNMSTLTFILELERKNYHDTYNFILCNDYRVYVCHYEKKMSPLTALVIIPLCFTIIAMLAGVADKGNIDDFVLEGVATTANTGIMLLLLFYTFQLC